VTREAVWVAQTPMGDMGIVLIEGENVAEANRRFTSADASARRTTTRGRHTWQ